MFDQLIDGARKASESTTQMQQEMFKQWTRMFTGTAHEAGATGEWGRTSQKRWVDLAVDMLNRHREGLDAMYRAGIALIESTVSVAAAKSPEDYRRNVEEIWRKLFDLQKQQSESQLRDFQTFYEKSSAIVQDARA
jgi:hypothetical protein